MNHDCFIRKIELIFESKISEAAKNVGNLIEDKYHIAVMNKGVQFILYRGSKYIGDMQSREAFNSKIEGIDKPVFSWHSDAPHGYGPLLYDIAMEFATLKGGYLVSHALFNRLNNSAGQDPTEEAEKIYEYYYNKRNDVAKRECPSNLIKKFNFLQEYQEKPYMYQLYQKKPDVLTQLINTNNNGTKVLTLGSSGNVYSNLSQLV